MRLIDADALIVELNDSHFPGAPYVDAGISIAIGKVCDATTIETEIICCDECKYSRDVYNDGDCYCCKPNEMTMRHVGRWDFYCADAKKGRTKVNALD